MQVENLEVGQVVKNYKVMCRLLEEDVKTNKKGQLEDWQRYIVWRKSGNSFIIEEIFDNPLQKIDNRGKGSVFGDMIQILIMDYLIESKKPSVVITRNKLLNHIKMINKNFSYCSENVPQLSKYIDIEEKIIYDFYNSSIGNFKRTVETALNNLRDKSLIMYEQVTTVCIKDQYHRVADEEEKQIILKCEKEILNSMGFTEISKVRVSSKWLIFKSKLSKLLQEKSDIQYFYISYRITVNEEYIYEEYEDLLALTLNELDRKEYKNELNATAIERLTLNAEKRKEKAFNSGKMSKYRMRESYIGDINKLIYLLIDSGANYIIDDVANIKKEEEKRRKDEAALLDGIEDFF